MSVRKNENLRELHSDYEEHIPFEDNKLFPLAAQLLNTGDLIAIRKRWRRVGDLA